MKEVTITLANRGGASFRVDRRRPLLDALEISATVVANLAIRQRMLDVARAVREGGGEYRW